MFMKEPHTALFVAPTGVGKTHLALNLLESEYRNHFDFIIIICPTLAHNKSYKSRSWVWTHPEVIPVEPGNQLYYLIEKVSNLLAGSKTLFSYQNPMEHPRAYEIHIKTLWNTQELMRFIESHNKTVTRLLVRDHKTADKRL